MDSFLLWVKLSYSIMVKNVLCSGLCFLRLTSIIPIKTPKVINSCCLFTLYAHSSHLSVLIPSLKKLELVNIIVQVASNSPCTAFSRVSLWPGVLPSIHQIKPRKHFLQLCSKHILLSDCSGYREQNRRFNFIIIIVTPWISRND